MRPPQDVARSCALCAAQSTTTLRHYTQARNEQPIELLDTVRPFCLAASRSMRSGEAPGHVSCRKNPCVHPTRNVLVDRHHHHRVFPKLTTLERDENAFQILFAPIRVVWVLLEWCRHRRALAGAPRPLAWPRVPHLMKEKAVLGVGARHIVHQQGCCDACSRDDTIPDVGVLDRCQQPFSQDDVTPGCGPRSTNSTNPGTPRRAVDWTVDTSATQDFTIIPTNHSDHTDTYKLWLSPAPARTWARRHDNEKPAILLKETEHCCRHGVRQDTTISVASRLGFPRRNFANCSSAPVRIPPGVANVRFSAGKLSGITHGKVSPTESTCVRAISPHISIGPATWHERLRSTTTC